MAERGVPFSEPTTASGKSTDANTAPGAPRSTEAARFATDGAVGWRVEFAVSSSPKGSATRKATLTRR